MMRLTKVPLTAIFEGSRLYLKGDALADPAGDEPFFDQPVLVAIAHDGPPTAQELRSVVRTFWLSKQASEDEEELGMTLIVQQHGGAPAGMVYFPDNQREVEIVEDDDEDGW